MSVADVQARISQIQAQIALLGGTGTRAVTAASGTAFADQLAATSATTGTGATTDATTTGATRSGDAVVAEARKYLGTPYVWGGTDPAKGLDCSGLVQLVYKNLGYDLPRVSYQQATEGRAVNGLANAKPGDLLAFGSPVHHIAIYVGDGKMIEEPRPGLKCREIDVYEKPTAIRRILPDSAVTDTGAPAAASRSVATGTPYADLFQAASARYGVDARLLAAVARQESGFNAKAVSPAGAQGLMQLMPGTARGLGVTNPFDPGQAVDGAARLLKAHLAEFGRVDLALAAYNAGPGAVHRYHGIPPYAETQKYVRNILAALATS